MTKRTLLKLLCRQAAKRRVSQQARIAALFKDVLPYTAEQLRNALPPKPKRAKL